MSKVSFRARQIDYNRTLPIIRYGSEAYDELGEGAFVNRGAPTIPSGMEREEENELHFLQVLRALQVQKDPVEGIPVPEIIDTSEVYEKLHPGDFALPKQLIHIRTIALEDEEPVEYDMDSEDEDWLRRSDLNLSAEKFESMIDRLERGCGQRVMNLDEAKLLLNDDSSLAIAVYDYWLNKRIQGRRPLLLIVRQEKRDGGSNNDPYVAFRRRTERMQTRKNRKNDEYSYEKMLLLREQMMTLGNIVSTTVKRESTKQAAVDIERRIFQLRFQVGDWEAAQLSEADMAAQKSPRSFERHLNLSSRKIHPSRKRRYSRRSPESTFVDGSDVSDTETRHRLNNPFAFIRLPGCKYQRPLDMRSPLETEDEAKAFQLSRVPRVPHSSRQRYTGYMRRRLGRGGRVIYDRTAASSEVENFFDQQDTQPSVAEHQSTLILRHAATSSLVPAEDNPLDAKIARRVGINNTNDSSPCEAIARRLQLSFLRKQSSPQLTLSLSRLTGGRRFSSTWHGSSGTRIYSPIPSSTLVNSLSSTPSVPCLMAATGNPVIVKATPTPPFKPVDIGKNKNHHRGVETNLAGVYCQVATSPRSSDGNTLAVGKALLAPSGGSTAAFRAATRGVHVVASATAASGLLSKKVALLNGRGAHPNDDSTFRWIPTQITPVRKTSSAASLLSAAAAVASVTTSSVTSKQPPTAVAEDSADGGKNSIIQPVVYNV